MIQGWVKLHKRMRKSKIWRRKNKNAMIVLVGLMMCVEYERKEKDGYILEAGETDMTIGQIAEECMLTTKQTRAALDFLAKKGALKRAQLWAHKRAQEGTRTTLVNWALYQSGEKTGTEGGAQTGTQVGNSLRREEVKNRESACAREETSTPRSAIDPEDFLLLWPKWAQMYPESVAEVFDKLTDAEQHAAMQAAIPYCELLEQVSDHQRQYVSVVKWLTSGQYKATQDAWKVSLKLKDKPARKAKPATIEGYEFTDEEKAAIEAWRELGEEKRAAIMTSVWDGEDWRRDINSEILVSGSFSAKVAHENRISIKRWVGSGTLRRVS